MSEFKYGTNGDGFKPLAEVLLSDVRQTFWARFQADGTSRGIQLEDLHKRMSELNLNSTVPEAVRTGFDTARNLFLYSWFVYRFQTVAELQAYATLEFALGKRLEAEGAGHIKNLSPRLNFAVDKGWLRADGVRVYQQKAESRKRYAEGQAKFFREFLKHENGWQDPDPQTEAGRAADYLRNLTGGIPKLRNSVAHGTPMLRGGTALTLEICCDLINQLFPEDGAN
ncbi:MAG TPA: hypothetical protein VEC99_12595 [Clostridia bacterium]|nr:hypothetical protein [Clostridia bacterium]